MAQFLQNTGQDHHENWTAINFLFYFLQYMILPVYCSMMLVYLLSCRREMVKQRWNVGGNREQACTTLAWLYLRRAV